MINKKKGFTLIELLVVIAIIGILSSVVLASLNSARTKSRDAKRISDLKQVQLALEYYFDANRTYPTTAALSNTAGTFGTALSAALVTTGYLPTIPDDPISATYEYYYQPATFSGGTYTACSSGCTSYVLGARLEDVNNPVLTSDTDVTVGTVFYGNAASCIASGGTEQCFSVTN
ncbi:MAG: prepilin-type N-terminal cleavage/methylation domain-containing protein [Candidatus Paceibacter sp.]|nr:prepilin-type N-terminal cleavage/methylation domain-containing protein [Candidatus Paceibacter sp.]